MLIIVEGADNSGKSRLAAFLSQQLGLEVKHSGGPPKHESEIIDRARSYLAMDNVIFDRFPVISEAVYSPILRKRDSILRDTPMPLELHARKPLIIYCRPPTRILLNFMGHQVKEHETVEHVQAVQSKAAAIISRYDEVMEFWNPVRYSYIAEHRGSYIKDLLVRYCIALQGARS